LQQLENLAHQLEERRAIGKYLADALRDLPGLRLVQPEPDSLPAWYAFPLLYDAEAASGVPRQLFVRALVAEGAHDVDIPGSTKPLTAFRAFTGEPATFTGAPAVKTRHRAEDFPGAERFHGQIVKLPGWHGADGLTYAQQYVSAIEKVLSQLDALRSHRD
jgi:dTDP-4-amino-4,6-dideoxygalactose transaminase